MFPTIAERALASIWLAKASIYSITNRIAIGLIVNLPLSNHLDTIITLTGAMFGLVCQHTIT